jgi:streptogramin lyase
MSTDDFTTRLGAQLYEAALRDERRGTLGSRLAQLRYAMPRTAAVAAGALAVLAIAAVVALGGLNWGSENTVTTPKVIRTFTLAENIGTMTTGFGAVWAVDSADGRILEVDPRTRHVRQRIPVSPEAIVNAGAGAVWVLDPISPTGDPRDGARLLRIDPSTGRVTARPRVATPAGGEFFPGDVVFARGAPWVVGAQGALRIDPDTGRPDRLVRVSPADGEPYPLWHAIADDGLWVLTRDQRIVRYDLDSGKVSRLLPSRLPGATGLTPTPEGPVLISPLEVARVNPRNGTMDWRIPLELSFPPGLEGNTLLAHARGGTTGGRDRLVALDLATGKLRYGVTLPEFGISGATNVGRQIWIGTPNGRVVVVQR